MVFLHQIGKLLGLTPKQADNHLSEIPLKGDGIDQADHILDHTLQQLATMEDSPEKIAFALLSLQKANDAMLRDHYTDVIDQANRDFEAGRIGPDELVKITDNALDSFANHGGLK